MKIINTKLGELQALNIVPTIESSESFEFLTEVYKSLQGAGFSEILDNYETRYPERDAPRQILEYSFLTDGIENQNMFRYVSQSLRAYWLVPFYHLLKEVPDITLDTFMELDLSLYPNEVREGYVSFYNGVTTTFSEVVATEKEFIVQEEIIDPDTQEIIQEEVRETKYGLVFKTAVSTKNSFICPAKIAIINGDVARDIGAKNWGQFKLKFDILPSENAVFEGVEVYPQYEGYDVSLLPLIMDSLTLNATLAQDQTVIDNNIGNFVQFTQDNQSQYIKPLNVILKDFNEFISFRKFLYTRQGKLVPFWLPLYETSFTVLNTGTIGASLTLQGDQLLTDKRRFIAVKSGTQWTYHKISSRTVSNGNTVVNITPSINKNVANISQICYMSLHRLNTDKATFTFSGTEAKCGLSILELDI